MLKKPFFTENCAGLQNIGVSARVDLESVEQQVGTDPALVKPSDALFTPL